MNSFQKKDRVKINILLTFDKLIKFLIYEHLFNYYHKALYI